MYEEYLKKIGEEYEIRNRSANTSRTYTDKFTDIFNNILVAFQIEWSEILPWWNESAMIT